MVVEAFLASVSTIKALAVASVLNSLFGSIFGKPWVGVVILSGVIAWILVDMLRKQKFKSRWVPVSVLSALIFFSFLYFGIGAG